MKYSITIIVLLFLGVIGTVFSAAPNKRGAGDFKECAAIRMTEINLKHLAKGDPKYFTQVPKGWVVVSGSGGEGHPKLLICR